MKNKQTVQKAQIKVFTDLIKSQANYLNELEVDLTDEIAELIALQEKIEARLPK